MNYYTYNNRKVIYDPNHTLWNLVKNNQIKHVTKSFKLSQSYYIPNTHLISLPPPFKTQYKPWHPNNTISKPSYTLTPYKPHSYTLTPYKPHSYTLTP